MVHVDGAVALDQDLVLRLVRPLHDQPVIEHLTTLISIKKTFFNATNINLRIPFDVVKVTAVFH